MNFPCAICQYIFKGDYLWNIHKSSLDEDRHLLCTPCLIKYSHKNAKCPLRCNNVFNPVQLNPGYKQLITLANEDFIKNNPTHVANPDDEILENRELWDKIITNIDEYINLDYYPNIYGTGLFRTLTCFMRTLKSTDFEDNISNILKMNNDLKLSNSLTVKIGIKRKVLDDQIEQERFEPAQVLEIDLRQLLDMERQE